jgi:ABC-type Fe3+-citrate transport system substrate-binding protein
MINIKRILTSTLVIAVLAFTACSDDDSSPKSSSHLTVKPLH